MWGCGEVICCIFRYFSIVVGCLSERGLLLICGMIGFSEGIFLGVFCGLFFLFFGM